jgi:hypothetical protein
VTLGATLLTTDGNISESHRIHDYALKKQSNW